MRVIPTSFLSMVLKTDAVLDGSASLFVINGTFSPTIISASSLSEVRICGVERTFTASLNWLRLKSAANPGTVSVDVLVDPSEFIL